MIIKTGDKDVEVRFGIAFVRALDLVYTVPSDFGTRMGAGLYIAIPKLLNDDPVVLAAVLKAGTSHLKDKPSQADIDAYLDNVDDIEAIFKEALEELKNSNATRLTYKKLAEITADLVETTNEIRQKTPEILTTTE